MKRKIINIYQPGVFNIEKFLMIIIFLCSGLIARSQESLLTVISNQNGPPAELKLSELKSIFMSEKQRWKNGTKVTVAIMKTSTPVGKKTAQVIYNMSGNDLLKYLLGLSNQGIAHAILFNTTSELQNFVAENPGAIGVIDHPLANNEIKIITIDGKTQFSL